MWLWVLLPISMIVIGNVGVWTTCVVAVQNGSVNKSKGVPYVSDCAEHDPEGPYLVQVLNTCGFLGCCIAVIRFLLVKNTGYYKKTNILSLLVGLFFSAGASLVGNFTEHSHFFIHLAASIIYCYGSMVYFWIQLFLIYWAEPSRDKRFTGPVLAVCCIAQTIAGNLIYILWFMGHRSDSAVCEFFYFTLLFLKFGFFIPEFSRIDCLQLAVQRQALNEDTALVQKNNCDARIYN